MFQRSDFAFLPKTYTVTGFIVVLHVSLIKKLYHLIGFPLNVEVITINFEVMAFLGN